MIKDQEPLPPETDPAVAAHIHRLRGHAELAQLQIAYIDQTVESLLRGGLLPPAPAAPPVKPKQPRGGDGSSGGAHADPLAAMDAKWGSLSDLPGEEGAS